MNSGYARTTISNHRNQTENNLQRASVLVVPDNRRREKYGILFLPFRRCVPSRYLLESFPSSAASRSRASREDPRGVVLAAATARPACPQCCFGVAGQDHIDR